MTRTNGSRHRKKTAFSELLFVKATGYGNLVDDQVSESTPVGYIYSSAAQLNATAPEHLFCITTCPRVQAHTS